MALFLWLTNELKSTGPTESPVGLCHKKNASTFYPLPDRRPAIYRSIQNEDNAVSLNVNRSFTGCVFRAASFPRTTFWTCSLPRSSTCAFGTCDSPFFPQVSTKREGKTAWGELFFPPTVCRLPSLGGRSVASFLGFYRFKRVETTGLEPATSGLQSRRSPS